jgi:hypothetical protein
MHVTYNIKMVLYINTRHDYLWVIFKVVSLNRATWVQTPGRKGVECSGERCCALFLVTLSIQQDIVFLLLTSKAAILVHSRSYVPCLYSQLFPRPQLIPHRKRKDNFIKIPKHDIKECPSGRSRVLPFQERERRRADMTIPIVIFRDRFEDANENLWNFYKYQHGLLRRVGHLLWVTIVCGRRDAWSCG